MYPWKFDSSIDVEKIAIEKIRELEELGVTLGHDPLTTGGSGRSYNNSKYSSITIGRTNIPDLIKTCDRLIDEQKQKLNYDSSIIDDLIKKAYKK